MGASFKFNKKEFSQEIENYKKKNSCTYIEAILALCEIHDIEPDTIGKLIEKPIKEKVDYEGQKLNLRPKKNELPI
jgi:hypothetical protein